VTVNKQGRITLPAKARRALGITGDSQLEVAVKDGALELRRTFVIPDEDRWAHTPEALASLRRGLADVKAGRTYTVWSASASDDLRIEFVRLGSAGKLLLRCSRHYRRP
jgi:AbrB family looped-hinge helix DNA binding protein